MGHLIAKIPVAFAAGLLSVVTPCVLPLVPGYLSAVSAVDPSRLGEPRTARRVVVASLPFIFGFTVYQSFESDAVKKSGHAPMPAWGERPVGGHAVMAVGYDETRQWFLVRNSWGAAWGMKGYFTMPYAYFIQPGLARDFWTIRLVG